jgi:hypothetical protein
MTLFRKNAILRNYDDIYKVGRKLEEGLEITHRRNENGEDYASLVGTKSQINRYLQDNVIISDRLRTLRSIPQYRIINTHKIRIQ